MTQPLIDPDDPDIGNYAGVQPFFLAAAGEVVRDYCGWTISPPVTDTYANLRIGSAGLIMLPSLYVTDVASVVINSGCDTCTLDPGDYRWFPQGYIEALSPVWRYGPYYTDYYTGLGSYYGGASVTASVTMTHGYDTCPLAVKSVALELAQAASEMPSGNATEVASPGYRIQFAPESIGLSLSDAQQSRLSKYRIGGLT